MKLELNIETVRQAILSTTKLKVKERHINVISSTKLHIEPAQTDRDKIYFSMQVLKNQLPNVAVKGVPTVVRAVISRNEKEEKLFDLLVEGNGLKEVMSTPGIDFAYTKSNHVMEVEQVLGIEAAR